jgi:hypothetical protein
VEVAISLDRGEMSSRGFTAYVRNLGIDVGRATIRRNFNVTIRRAASGRNCDLKSGALHVKHAMPPGIWVPTRYLL